jgi:hypothetical protein
MNGTRVQGEQGKRRSRLVVEKKEREGDANEGDTRAREKRKKKKDKWAHVKPKGTALPLSIEGYICE